MNASDLAAISAASVLGFAIIHIALLFGFWISTQNEIRAVRAEILAAGVSVRVRVSDAELEQARMRGVMSVIQPQAHTHESTGTRPNPPDAD